MSSTDEVPSACGLLGYPGKGGDGVDIRLYTESECTALGGKHSSTGVCSPFTWDCRALNKSSLAMAYQYRYHIGAVVLVGGILYWRSSRR